MGAVYRSLADRSSLVAADRYDPYGLYFAPGYVSRFYQKYKATYVNPKINLVSQIENLGESFFPDYFFLVLFFPLLFLEAITEPV